MADPVMLKTDRASLRGPKKPDMPAEGEGGSKDYSGLTIDFSDNGGGTVRLMPKSQGDMPFGGEAKTNAFESREALAKFVNDAILGAAVDTAAQDAAAGPVDAPMPPAGPPV